MAEQKQITNQLRKQATEIAYLKSQLVSLKKVIGTIFKIWDCTFKTIGVIGLAAFVGFIVWATRSLYYTDGKWDFGVIVFGTLVCVAILVLGIWAIFAVINAMLVNKIELN